MIEAKLILTLLVMGTIQLVAHFGARAKRPDGPADSR
jgi:hypothetical protein